MPDWTEERWNMFASSNLKHLGVIKENLYPYIWILFLSSSSKQEYVEIKVFSFFHSFMVCLIERQNNENMIASSQIWKFWQWRNILFTHIFEFCFHLPAYMKEYFEREVFFFFIVMVCLIEWQNNENMIASTQFWKFGL